MIEKKLDLWKFWGKALICITTNGVVTQHGRCVMGRGCALEAKNKFPGIDLVLGTRIRKNGNRVQPIMKGIAAFPVKHRWDQKADLDLIDLSCRQLVWMSDKFKIKRVVLPRPGCGNGSLEWEQVKPILKEYLDNRFLVVHK